VLIIKLPFLRQATAAHSNVHASADGLDAFEAEGDKPRPPRPQPPWVKPLMLAAVTVALGVAGGVWAYRAYAVAPALASLSIETTPPGAEVMVDGRGMGVTPAALTLPPGTYGVVLTGVGGQRREAAVTLKAGDSVVHQVEWAEPAPVAPAPTLGALHVQTEPPGQVVFVDDIRRGLSPMTVTDLAPGDHAVHVSSSAGTFRRRITITAGETMSLVIAPNAPVVSAGWLRISSPVLLQVRVGGDLVGNTESDRVLLPAGEHDLDLSNESLGYAVRRRVRVESGRTAQVQITPPTGMLSINALPWAEVWIGGERLGETPIANVSRPIGTHAVILRHPQLGERRTTVTVSLKETARLGIDMRQP
jgi:hypothetical protein